MAVGIGSEVSITELVFILQQLNAELSDAQALAEAHNILNMADSGVVSTAIAIRGTSEISTVTGGSAQAALAAYVNAGGKLSASGAASASAITSANVTAFEAGGAVSAGGILSLSLPTVAAAIAPVLGVGLGIGLYEANPELWTKISQTLLPFCWEDTDVIPAVVDKDGQVYLDGKIFDSMKQLFEDEEIRKQLQYANKPTLPDGTKLNSNIIKFKLKVGGIKAVDVDGKDYAVLYSGAAPIASYDYYGKYPDLYNATETFECNALYIKSKRSVPNILAYYITDDPKLVQHQMGPAVIRFRDSFIFYKGSWTYFKSKNLYGKIFYYFFEATTNLYDAPVTSLLAPVIDIDGTGDNVNDILWYAQYGDFVDTEYFPEGAYEWKGQVPSDYTQNGINVIKNSAGESTKFYPVTLPIGDSGVSNNPETLPNPQGPTPILELGKYIPTIVQPSQYPSTLVKPDEETRTAPLPTPLLPSLIIDTALDPSLKYTPPKDPPITGIEENIPPTISSGNTPTPIFPIPGEFPSIVPTSGSGLIHVYNPTPAEMIAFGNWLWVTYADASIQKLWNNPFDGVISAHELYATPSTDGKDNIRSGFLVCPTQALLVRQRYTEINCGSIVVPEWYNNYLDYAPYSKAHVYLPFIGIVELDVDDIVGHGVNILYHVDAYNGSCIAQITVAKTDYNNTVYQFSGNCAVDMPLAGGSQASIRAGLIGAAATGISSVVGGLASLLSGNVGGAIAGVSYGIGNAVTQAVSQKSSVQHSGTFGASYGAMGIKKPYIIIRRPIQKQVLNYNAEYGFPAHKRVVIGQCQGFLRVREVHVQSPTATIEERRRIDELLREGIIINTIESSEEIE